MLSEFIELFKANYKRYIMDSDQRKHVRKEYQKKLWRLETPSRFRDLSGLSERHSLKPIVTGIDTEEGLEFIGMIRGLSPIGNLIIEDTKDNSLKEFSFKEIAYIL